MTVCPVLNLGVISKSRVNKEVEVRFGEYVSGASPAPVSTLGTSNSRDRDRIPWNRALIVRNHRESTVSRQALRAVILPAAPLVRGDTNFCAIGNGDPWYVARACRSRPSWTLRRAYADRSAPRRHGGGSGARRK